MLLFRCELTYNELTALKNYLPVDEYCIVGDPRERVYYGAIRASAHSRFMDILSGETLELLEYVDEEELRQFLSKQEHPELFGNAALIEKMRG